ncbi:PREDICTED: M-phase inducer phosphatase 3-like [Elephantulus edwardii]|uniref:M-phase inducer phosphatase 3-like n=1 Tax=Elephantulus edwardii TaxID=28737 RepID=UPI0003F06D2F|nr:PREDICTED: M-phase inducer phosphatase 3-like [Elephantulus edwardii]
MYEPDDWLGGSWRVRQDRLRSLEASVVRLLGERKNMSANLFSSTREEGSPGSRSSFRASQRKMLNLLMERDTSFTIGPNLPKTPVDKHLGDSGNLSFSSGGTPKRCLDLSDLSSGEMSANQLTTPAELDETGHLDSSRHQEILLPEMNHHQHLIKGSPAQLLCSTPNSLDCGRRKKEAVCGSSANKKNENYTLKSLEWLAPSNLKFKKRPGGPFLSPLSLLDNQNMLGSETNDLGSPIATIPKWNKKSELGEDQSEDISDDLMELSLEEQKDAKVSLNRSYLYRSPSMPENLNRPRLKQVVKFKDNPIPDKVKKKHYSSYNVFGKDLSLKKTVSLCDISATQIPEDSEGLLTGDFSKVCALPTVSGMHQDLKYVNPETVAALLWGKFQGLIEKFYIIDCRYPYEYLGGHIQGALNVYSQEELYNFFLKKPIVPLDSQKRIIIVFHCEFSSERGPRMCRSLREEDRALNKYPALHYPELYILKGGYRDFFPEYTELCEPQNYCPMHHQDHKAELLSCRSQTKAWEGKRQLQEQIALLVKDMKS